MATRDKLHSGPKRRRFGRTSGPAGTQGLRAIVSDDVCLMIEGHVLATPEMSVSGVLVGHVNGPGGKPQVTGLIESPPSPVKFTLRVWERIQERHRNEHPGTELIGWYQSRAGAGMVFTQHDGLVHSKFFGEPGQFAYMVDPELRKEGVFGWHQGEIVLLAEGPMAARSAKDAPAPALAPDIAAAVAAQTAERDQTTPAPALLMPAASPQAPSAFAAAAPEPEPFVAAEPGPANTVRMSDPDPEPRATVRMAAPAAAKRAPSRRARGLAWGAGAILILVAGASAVALGRWDTSRTEAEQAVVPKVAVPVAAAATPAAAPVTDTAAIEAAKAAADKLAAAKAARHKREVAGRAREQRARDRRQATRRATARRAAARRAAAARVVAARRRTTTTTRAPVTTTRAPVTRAPVVAARKPSAPAKSTSSGSSGTADPGNAANVSVVPPVD